MAKYGIPFSVDPFRMPYLGRPLYSRQKYFNTRADPIRLPVIRVLHADFRPLWYERLLEARPEIVAEVQVRFAASEFRRGSMNIHKLWELARDPHHTQVARIASLPLLRSFPTRCKLLQIQSLDHLLWAAIQHADRVLFQELIEKKLSLKSMNPAQRVHWLAAGFMVAQERYQDLLHDFVRSGRDQQRIRHLVAFFSPMNRIKPWMEYLDISAKEHLIRILGSAFEPYDWKNESGFDWNPPGEEDFDLIRPLINSLENTADQDASHALRRLIEDPTVTRWRDLLSRAQSAQRVMRRDTIYHHPSIEQICNTLKGSTPTNAADLAALLFDILDNLAKKIRDSSPTAWRQYWNVDKYNRPENPKPENACRDTLLFHLQSRIENLGIDAQPGGRYADDNRSDIRASFGGFNVPVEIKRSCHRDLWTAIKSQLIPKYTRDPGASGHGIYLVFWFGGASGCSPTKLEGWTPPNAQAVMEKLTELLSDQERQMISICVIDVSRPHN